MGVSISGTTGIEVKGVPFLIGQVCFFAMATPPAGFLVCDGSAVSRTSYAAAFNAMGTLYGSGDGSTTFNLPDLRGEFIRGADMGRGADAGRAIGSWQKGSLISGNENSDSQVHSFYNVATTRGGLGWDVTDLSGYSGFSGNVAGADQAGGFYSSDHYGIARPRNVALLPCVFVGV